MPKNDRFDMPLESATMLDYMFKLRTVVFIECASLAILIFDYMLTFGREIDYVWFNSPWNIGRVLYLLTRYLPFGGVFVTFIVDAMRNVPLPLCRTLTQIAVYFTVADIIIAEIILTMRVWAIWHRNRYVCFSLVAICLALSSVSVATIAKVPAQQDIFGDDLHSAYGVCPPYFASSKAINMCFVALAVYESVLLTLTLVKAIDMYRHLDVGTSSFIDIFFVDGLFYNGFILVGSTANIIVRYKTAPTEYINLLISLQPVFHSVLTSRMMLHLKQNVVKASQNNHLLSIHSIAPSGQGHTTSETGGLLDYVTNVDHATRSWFGDNLRQTDAY